MFILNQHIEIDSMVDVLVDVMLIVTRQCMATNSLTMCLPKVVGLQAAKGPAKELMEGSVGTLQWNGLLLSPQPQAS